MIKRPLVAIRHESGYAFIGYTGLPDLSSHDFPSQAILLEDGKALQGPANALHQDIREVGGGQYSYWHDNVYFSTSDNSDPCSNGRIYEIFCLPIPMRLACKRHLNCLEKRFQSQPSMRWMSLVIRLGINIASGIYQLPRTFPSLCWAMTYRILFAYTLMLGRARNKQ